MVKKFLNYFNKEIGGLHQAAYLLGLFAFLSQLLAFVRDRLLAHALGAGETLDLYYAAFRIPDFIFATVASTVSLSVLIPLFVDKLSAGKEAGKRFLDTIFTFFLLAMTVTCAAAFLLMPALMQWLFPGVADQSKLVELSRILLLSPIILGLSNHFGSVTQSYKRFFLYATSPLLYNMGIVGGIVLLFPSLGIVGVAFGVVVGAVMHLGVQMPFVWSRGFLPAITWKLDWAEARRVVIVSLPRTLALGISQISTLFMLSFASVMTAGSIAIFTLAYNLQSVSLSIIGVSYSMAAFPTLAKLYSRGDHRQFVEHTLTSARHIVFWSLPLAVLFVVLRAHIVRVVLGSGNFNWSDTRLTAAALGLFMLSSVFQGLVLLFTRAFYSAGNTKKPLLANAFSGLCIVLFAAMLAEAFQSYPVFRYFIEALFRVGGISGTEALMLPLGFTLGSVVNGALLWALFEREFKGLGRPLLRTFFHCFAAAVLTGTAAYLSLSPLSGIFDNETFVGVFLQGLIAGLAGAIVGIATLKALRNREIDEIWKALHAKFWKAKPVSPDPTVST